LAKEEAQRVTEAVAQVLKHGYRTGDIADANTDPDKIVGTKEMGHQVLDFLKQSVLQEETKLSHADVN
jgi:3-isopropylmalate dehydrogenase